VSWRAWFKLPAFLGAVLTATLGLVVGVTSVTSASALASVRAHSQFASADDAVSAFFVSSSTTAAGATEVNYTVDFAPSATGALAQGQGTVTLSLPGATFNNANVSQGFVSFDDLTSGANGGVYAMQGMTSDDGATLTMTSPIDIAAGDAVQVTYSDVTNPSATGTPTASFSTSSDTTPATASFSVTAGDQQVSGLSVQPSATAAGVSGVSYTVDFTASATGVLVQNQGTVTLALPSGSAFAGEVQFDDQTTGATGIALDSRGSTSDSGATLTITSPVAVAAGDSVQLTYTNATNAPVGGGQQATLATSSDTQPVAASFTLTGGQSVTVSEFAASTSAAGATGVSYTAQFTTSSTGALASGTGTITLTAPAGTAFSGPVTVTDLTASAADRAGKSSAVIKPTGAKKASAAKKAAGSAGSSGDVTETVTVPIDIAAGDKVSVVWADVTNPSVTGAQSLTLATSSDTLPATQVLTFTSAKAVSSVTAKASTTAASATQVTYTVGFTASSTGALVPGEGDIILSGPAGMVFSSSASYQADDVTSGQASGLSVINILGGGSGVKLNGGIAIAAGDQVVITASDVTNPSATGPEQLTVNTTSDTVLATAGIILTAGNQPVGAISAMSLSTTAAGASEVSYQLTFTASATGALAADSGTVTLTLPSGSGFQSAGFASVDVQDLTSGTSSWANASREMENSSNTELTVPVPVAIAAGDQVRLTFAQVSSAGTTGQKVASFSTSSDTKPVTTSFTLTAGNVPVTSFSGPSLTATAAGASEVDYQLQFTASATGQLANGYGTVTLSLAPGTNVDFSTAEFDDLTSGHVATSNTLAEGNNANTVTATVPFDVAAGDQVQVTFPGTQSAPAPGNYTATFATSSDTKPVTGSYTLTQAAPVAAPSVTVSDQTAGETATYTVTFTTSPGGNLTAGEGQIVLAAPAGTVFDGGAAYTGLDITSGKPLTLTVADTSDNGATITLVTNQQISGGSQLTITAPGVTNATSTGTNALDISTSTDTVPAGVAYTLGDSPPQFTAASPPLAIAPGSSQGYTFATTGWPPATYSLSGAPSWLSINPTTGQLSGTAPASSGTFTYSVTAANSAGTATEGPYTVTIEATATISGSVVDSSGNPVSNVEVDACDTSGNACESATTDDTGAFSLAAVVGTTIVLTAYPPPGSAAGQASTGAIQVPSGGLSGQTITVSTSFQRIGKGLLINGSSTPVVNWASPSTATYTGCADGVVTVSVEGPNTLTGEETVKLVRLTENPVGSGDYTGTIPPLEPIHGPVNISDQVYCPTSSAVTPAFGDTGQEVLISGSGFTGATGVKFGSTAATTFTVLSSSLIEAVVPAGNGDVTVTVQTPSGNAPLSGANTFSYLGVTGISPSSGPAAGGTTVTITGTGFTGATSVIFGSNAAQSFNVVSDSEITAVSPPGSGAVDVRVLKPSGATSAVPADVFTYPGSAQTATRVAAAAPGSFSAPSAATLLRAVAAGGGSNPNIGALVSSIVNSLQSQISAAAQNLANDAVSAIPNFLVCNKVGAAVLKGLIDAYVAGRLVAAAGAIIVANRAAIIGLLLLLEVQFGIGAAIAGFLLSVITPELILAITGILASILSVYLDPFVDKALEQKCNETPPSNPNALVDPSGTVLDGNGNPVSGATVTILRSYTEDGAYLPVSTSDPGISPAVNPEVTKADGSFHWDVSAGYYKVQAVKSGCTTAEIGPYPVPPPQLGLTITMQCTNEAKPAAPVVSSISAPAGPVTGGTVLTVLGSNFTPASTVKFGATAAASVTYVSPQALSVTTPKGSGLVDVLVSTAGGTSAKTTADRFFFGTAPSVAKISPATGPAAGGTTVTIAGANFTGATSVTFGGFPVSKFTVKSATEIVAVTGKGTAGAAEVQVANPAGSGGSVVFNYLAPVAAYVATSAGVVPIAEGAAKAGSAAKVAGAAGLASTPDGDTVVVAGSTGATEISTASGHAVGTIPAGKSPKAVAVTPNGAVAYVLNYGSGSVTPVAVATGLAGKPIAVGSQPTAVAITPNGSTAYVVNYGSNSVTPIAVATGKAGTAIKVGSHPDAIAITPNGQTAYVGNSGSGSVTPIAVATGKAGKAIAVGKDPVAIAITPNGTTAYVVNYGSNSVTPIAMATGKAGNAIVVGTRPDAIVLTPNGKTGFVLDSGAETVTPFAVATGKAGKAIAVGKDPVAAAVTPDGTTLYVLGYASGTVTPVAVATGKPGKAIAVGKAPAAITITR
jgi:YVTN family beta-propeller protein